MLVVLRVKDIPSGSPAGIIFYTISLILFIHNFFSKTAMAYFHSMKLKYQLLLILWALGSFTALASANKTIDGKGKLFIIGGGGRSPELMSKLLEVSGIASGDYIVILPMAGAEPDSSFFYIRQDFEKVTHHTIVQMNFTKETVSKQSWIDSLKNAKLIFITGGDQNRFMKIVLHTPVHDAILSAFANGATIAGTSAGAAVMSKEMITGNEMSGDSIIEGNFRKIRYHLPEIKEGLGLLTTAIIDQHFVVRSRYNRLLSVLAAYPSLTCIGIDEATAIIVKGRSVTVTGSSQVLVFTLPAAYEKRFKVNDPIRLKNIRLDILTAGDSFAIK